MKTILIILMSLSLILCSCNSNKITYTYKEIEHNYDSQVNSHEMIRNDVAEYAYSISLFDKNGNAISDSNPLVLSQTTTLKMHLQCDSMFKVQFGVILLSSYTPIEYSVDQNPNHSYCYSVSSSKSAPIELELSFSPVLTSDVNTLHIILIENSDSLSSSLPDEKDFSYALNIPISVDIESSVQFSDLVSSGDQWLDNLYKIFNYDSLSEIEQEFIETNITAIKNNSLNISLSTEEAPSLSTKNTLVTSLSENTSGWLKCYGQAGKYATIIFVDNTPIKGFNDKYCLVWNATSYDQYLNAPFTLQDPKTGIHTVYALTLALDDSDKQIIYDSYKIGLLVLEDSSNDGSILDNVTTIFYDSRGNVLDPQDNVITYDSEEIYLKFSHSLLESYLPRNYNLFILCDGIIQDFFINDFATSNHSYTLEPRETNTLDIKFTPVYNDKLNDASSYISLDILFIPELANLQNSDLDNTTTFHKRYYINYNRKSTSNNSNIFELSATELNSTIDTFSISVSTPDAPKIEYKFMGKYMKNNSVTMNYEAIGLPQGSYIVLALLNGQPIDLFPDTKYITYSIGSPNQKVEFMHTLNNTIDKNLKIVFLTISLDQNITRTSHIYYNQLMLEQVNYAETSIGSVFAYRDYDGSYENYVSFEGKLPSSSYCSSYNYIHRRADESMLTYDESILAYGYSDYMNSFPISSSKFNVEYFESPSAWIVENIIHIYSPHENGFTVTKYRTPVNS